MKYLLQSAKTPYWIMKIEYSDYITAEQKRMIIEEFMSLGIQIDSILLSKNGRIALEEYFGIADSGRAVDVPNSQHSLNRMFSVCKSFTSIAIGLLIDENKMSLSDRIVDYFSMLFGEELPPTVDDGIRKTTIEDMLTMRTSHSKTTYRQDMTSDWVRSFFVTPSDKAPGENFTYDTSSTHVLCALCEKISGMNMLDYIKSKMPELGLSDDSYIMKDPFGVSLGGTGLMCTTKDLYRFAMLIEKKGIVDGRRLISESYLERAISPRFDKECGNGAFFEGFGYGYCFWCKGRDSYMCYGMNGQFIYFVPKRRVVVIVTSNCSKITHEERKMLSMIENVAYNL